MNMRLMILLWILFSYSLQAQEFIFDNYVYTTNIKSVKFHPTNLPLDMPVAYINNGSLDLSFDDLDADIKEYTYKIIHCTYDWQPSGIGELEYLEGYLNGEIRNSQFSKNTFVPYTHYKLRLPNRDYQWTKSGNFLLVVYEGKVDDHLPVITRRFMVVDPKVGIEWRERGALGSSRLYADHVFDLKVTTNDYRIVNPIKSVKTVILQNNRWNDAIYATPTFIQGRNIVIDNTGKISFPAHKEFRDFDIRSLDFSNVRIENILLNEDGTDVYIQTDRPREGLAYLTNKDANGQYVIQNKDQGNDDTYADYANVYFTLDADYYDEDVYIAGDFTDWKADEMYRMEYNEEAKRYETNLLLKQGYYNYLYALQTEKGLDFSEIEGSNTDTENNYQVFVYLSEPGDRYDRLISFTSFNSKDF